MLVICKILIIRIFLVLIFCNKIVKKGQFIVCIAYYLAVAHFIDYSPQFAQDQPQHLWSTELDIVIRTIAS